MSKLIEKINKEQIRTDIPEFRVGDTVRVGVRIKEGKKERVQNFEELQLYFCQKMEQALLLQKLCNPGSFGLDMELNIILILDRMTFCIKVDTNHTANTPKT